MSDPMNDNKINQEALDHASEAQGTMEGMLGDEQRVKVLSPGMMVFKRFIRNRLAITGLIILVAMFLFSFVGGLLTPYRQDQTFYTTEKMLKEYAGATRNAELRYVVAKGASFDRGAYARLVLAVNNSENSFSSGSRNYTYEELGEKQYLVSEMQPVANVTVQKIFYSYEPKGGFKVSDAFKTAFEAAQKAKAETFEHDGQTYEILYKGREHVVGQTRQVALASMHIFDAARREDAPLIESFEFRLAAETAIAAKEGSFSLEGETYTVSDEDGVFLISKAGAADGELFATISDVIINAISPEVFLSLDFKAAATEAIEDKSRKFTFEEVEYTVDLVHQTYQIKRNTDTHVFDMYRSPDAKHPLGTDQNGMDVLTRLMYGGRISLMVGFVVVILEIIIGVIIGGISGYFGGWVDTLLMRFIDLFNCIPFWPILIITGAVMDSLEVDPIVRVFLMMLILGLMGWTGIARVVRGQILALREQDFMVATEATGVRVSRRIAKHLVPNVMPLLIVQATMGLGGIILTEATLSFLGLGIKHPLASWGSIINAASEPYVMNNFAFIWLPAGMLILLTVLGFNFVGDGLRDAFDPKMKR